MSGLIRETELRAMTQGNPPPPVFHILTQKEADVRVIAEQLNLSCSITALEGRPEITEFRFEPMDDEQLYGLVNAIPLDAFAYRAVVGGVLP
jgi:hypothetical protein